MRTLSDNSTSAVSAPITSPGFLVSIGFEVPLYLSSRGDVLWNDLIWQSYNFSISGLGVSAINATQNGSLTVIDSDRSFATLVLEDGIADRAIAVWKFYGEDPATDDPVAIFDGVGDSANIVTGTGQVQINLLLQSSGAMLCPRRVIGRTTGFNFLPPAGTIISWNNEQFVLKGSDQ